MLSMVTQAKNGYLQGNFMRILEWVTCVRAGSTYLAPSGIQDSLLHEELNTPVQSQVHLLFYLGAQVR